MTTSLCSGVTVLGSLLLLASCSAPTNQAIKIDGSSTVFPITDAVAKAYNQTQSSPVAVEVGVSGTGGGFDKFCAGETDINNASRPISEEEMAACDR
ncbi:MAG TPA: substrate-binding domain-containing protein, partial [Leptolyngbyaceae cyanobacterium]